MPSSKKPETAVDPRIVAGRLRDLKDDIQSFGKRGLADTFAAGAALEEAADLLRGSYSSWVKAECGLEPRTALGFRKTFRNLAGHKEMLLEKNVSASVAIMVACAKPEACERALKAIASGRSLSVKEAKLVLTLGGSRPAAARPAAIASLDGFMRRRSAALVAEVSRVVALVGDGMGIDDARLVEIAVRARAIKPLLSSLDCRMAGAVPTRRPPSCSS